MRTDYARRRLIPADESETGVRAVPLPAEVVAVLRAWRERQAAERLAGGLDWPDTGRVFTREDGTAVPAQWVSVRFETLAYRAGLPPVRFHDLRHGAASLCKVSGVASAASFGGSGERCARGCLGLIIQAVDWLIVDIGRAHGRNWDVEDLRLPQAWFHRGFPGSSAGTAPTATRIGACGAGHRCIGARADGVQGHFAPAA